MKRDLIQRIEVLEKHTSWAKVFRSKREEEDFFLMMIEERGIGTATDPLEWTKEQRSWYQEKVKELNLT